MTLYEKLDNLRNEATELRDVAAIERITEMMGVMTISMAEQEYNL